MENDYNTNKSMKEQELNQAILRLLRKYSGTEIINAVNKILFSPNDIPLETNGLSIVLTEKKKMQYERDSKLYQEYLQSGLTIRQFAKNHTDLKERQVYNIIKKFANQ